MRTGSSFVGFYSATGTNWTQVGSTQTVAVAALATVGLCVDSHNNTNLYTSTFSNVSVTGVFPCPRAGRTRHWIARRGRLRELRLG